MRSDCSSDPVSIGGGASCCRWSVTSKHEVGDVVGDVAFVAVVLDLVPHIEWGIGAGRTENKQRLAHAVREARDEHRADVMHQRMGFRGLLKRDEDARRRGDLSYRVDGGQSNILARDEAPVPVPCLLQPRDHRGYRKSLHRRLDEIYWCAVVKLDRELQRLRVDIARQPPDEIVLVGVLVIAQSVEDAGLACHGLVAGGPLMPDEICALPAPDRERDLVDDI